MLKLRLSPFFSFFFFFFFCFFFFFFFSFFSSSFFFLHTSERALALFYKDALYALVTREQLIFASYSSRSPFPSHSISATSKSRLRVTRIIISRPVGSRDFVFRMLPPSPFFLTSLDSLFFSASVCALFSKPSLTRAIRKAAGER
jgi:hypothetical protein